VDLENWPNPVGRFVTEERDITGLDAVALPIEHCAIRMDGATSSWLDAEPGQSAGAYCASIGEHSAIWRDGAPLRYQSPRGRIDGK
jgi:hypothetical protein